MLWVLMSFEICVCTPTENANRRRSWQKESKDKTDDALLCVCLCVFLLVRDVFRKSIPTPMALYHTRSWVSGVRGRSTLLNRSACSTRFCDNPLTTTRKQPLCIDDFFLINSSFNSFFAPRYLKKYKPFHYLYISSLQSDRWWQYYKKKKNLVQCMNPIMTLFLNFSCSLFALNFIVVIFLSNNLINLLWNSTSFVYAFPDSCCHTASRRVAMRSIPF